MNVPHKIHPNVAALIVIVLLSASTAGLMALDNDKTQTPTSMNTTQDMVQTQNTASATRLKDGDYTSSGSYRTPGGTESIGLTVTLENNIIKDVILEQRASGGDTEVYQSKFASGYRPLVIGKNIDEVELSRVAGSSLTSNGFNDALDKIKQDAAS